MKILKSFENFVVNEAKKKNYTPADHKKDVRRLEDIQEKAEKAAAKKGTSVEEEMIKLATTQANRIKNIDKAHYRGIAASDMGMEDVAEVFFKISDKLLKAQEELVKETYETYEVDETYNNPEYDWFVTLNGRIVSGWEYLLDAIKDGVLTDNLDEDVDEYDMNYEVEDRVSDELGGFGEPGDDPDDYDQDILDDIVSDLIEKYCYEADGYRVVKRDEIEKSIA